MFESGEFLNMCSVQDPLLNSHRLPKIKSIKICWRRNLSCYVYKHEHLPEHGRYNTSIPLDSLKSMVLACHFTKMSN